MAYRISRKKPVEKNIRRIALEQLDKAIAEINSPELDRNEAVHQVRRRCKKLRGLIRLVRPVFDHYEPENIWFRDAARDLSKFRDSQSVVECFDCLINHFHRQIDEVACSEIKEVLVSRRRKLADDSQDLDDELEKFLVKLHKARRRVTKWKIDEDGFAAVGRGLEQTYLRGRHALQRAYESPSAERFHDWRKRVKYHGYHARLLHQIWPDMLAWWQDQADALADILGDEHDLWVLDLTLREDPPGFGNRDQLHLLHELIDSRRAELQSQARILGEHMFAEKPAPFAARLESYWESWKKQR